MRKTYSYRMMECVKCGERFRIVDAGFRCPICDGKQFSIIITIPKKWVNKAK